MREGTIEQVLAGEADWVVVTGDCLHVLPTIPAGSVGACITDPPYGVGLSYTSCDDSEQFVRDVVVPACVSAIGLATRAAITPGTRCAWFYPRPRELGQVFFPAGAGFSRWGFTCSQPILYYGSDPYPPNNKRPNSWQCTETAHPCEHPCPKPDGWMRWLVQRASLPGEVVIDPFCGSGTTGVACIKTGRRFIGIEIDPTYADIARRRIREAEPVLFTRAKSEQSEIWSPPRGAEGIGNDDEAA